MHPLRDQSAVGALYRSHADVATRLELIGGHLLRGDNLGIGREVERNVAAFARLNVQHVSVQRADGPSHAHIGLGEGSCARESEQNQGKAFHSWISGAVWWVCGP